MTVRRALAAILAGQINFDQPWPGMWTCYMPGSWAIGSSTSRAIALYRWSCQYMKENR